MNVNERWNYILYLVRELDIEHPCLFTVSSCSRRTTFAGSISKGLLFRFEDVFDRLLARFGG